MKFQRLRKTVILTFSLLTGWLSLVSSQTIVIERGIATTAREGESFELNCVISGTVTGATSIAWAKDDQILVWSNNGMAVVVNNTGDFLWEEKDLPGTIHFTLRFPLFDGSRHNGYYKCFLAQGNLMNFIEITSAITQVTAAYFPSEEWPKCIPSDEFKALIYTEMTIRCVSTIGYPEVSMNFYRGISTVPGLQRGNISSNFIEQSHKFTVMPQDRNNFYFCRIERPEYGHRDCSFGYPQVQLFEEHIVKVLAGNDVVINCTAGLRNEIRWTTSPYIYHSRLDDSHPNLLQITNVQIADNGTLVRCMLFDIVGVDIQDQVQLVVNSPSPLGTSTIKSATEHVSNSLTEPLRPSSNFSISTSTRQTEVSDYVSSSSDTVIAVAVGVGSVVFVICLFAITVGVILCHRKMVKDRITHQSPASQMNVNGTSTNRVAQSDTYSDLNLAEVHSSDYASLSHDKRNDKSTHAYVNVDPNNDFTDANVGDAYAELNLTEVHSSDYTSLNHDKRNDKSTHAYVNVDPNNDATPYEVNLFPKNCASYVNVA